MLSEGPVLLAPLLQRQVPVHGRVDLLVGRLHDAERHGDDGGHGPADYHEGFLAGFRQEEQRDRQKDEQQEDSPLPSRDRLQRDHVTGRATRYRELLYWDITLTLASRSNSSRIFPTPNTTEVRGSSTVMIGRFVSSRKRVSMPFSKDPPPVSTTPRSIMSPANSGGVFSSATLIALTIVPMGSCSASRISASSTTNVRGMPEIKSRPLIIIVLRSSKG